MNIAFEQLQLIRFLHCKKLKHIVSIGHFANLNCDFVDFYT